VSDEKPAPIIIIKKKGRHGGHHGGAWKVAYADFVTAMMALFIVLWLLNTSEEVQKAISSYFRDPSGEGKEMGSSSAGTGESISVKKDDMGGLKEKLEQAMKKSPEIEKLKDNVQFSVTGEGLRIEMLENEKGMFFESGSPKPTPAGEELLRLMAEELGKLPNDLLIEGHTDARPFAGRAGYTNWELSTERANAARRLMETSGVRQGQVVQVRGFADRQLRNKEQPEAAGNRRISVIVRYQSPAPESGSGKTEARGDEKKTPGGLPSSPGAKSKNEAK
jgi:chemotaxis protein MotB